MRQLPDSPGPRFNHQTLARRRAADYTGRHCPGVHAPVSSTLHSKRPVMSSPQTNASKPTTPPNPAQTVVRIILFAILAYMIFALAYDYGYVFPTHEAKAEELRK